MVRAVCGAWPRHHWHWIYVSKPELVVKVIFRFSDSSWCCDAISSDSVDHLVFIVLIV